MANFCRERDQCVHTRLRLHRRVSRSGAAVLKRGSDFGRLSINELMRAIGTKEIWDPFIRSQYRTFVDKRYSPFIRLWAWVASKTLGNKSDYCIDENGRELHLNDAAADLHMDPAAVRRAWAQLEHERRVKKAGSKLLICGDVSLPNVQDSNDEEGLYSPVPGYLEQQLRKLHSEEDQERFRSRFEHVRRRFRVVHAELVRAVRSIEEEEQDALLREFGLTRNRQRKRRMPPIEAISAIRPVYTRIVQSLDNSVQNQDAASYGARSDDVLSSTSLFIEYRDRQKTPAAAVSIGELTAESSGADENGAAVAEVPAAADGEAIAQVYARCIELAIAVPDESTALQVYRRFAPHLEICKLPKVRPDQRSARLWLRVTPRQMVLEAARLEHPELTKYEPTARELREKAERAYIMAGLRRARADR